MWHRAVYIMGSKVGTHLLTSLLCTDVCKKVPKGFIPPLVIVYNPDHNADMALRSGMALGMTLHYSQRTSLHATVLCIQC